VLAPLSVAKLFSDQAVPTGGVSGTAFLVAALHKRGIQKELCMAVLLISLSAYYAAFLLVTMISLLLLWLHHGLEPWIIALAVLVLLLAIGVVGLATWLRSRGRHPWPRPLLRFPGLTATFSAFSAASADLLRDRRLLVVSVALHTLVFVLDAATLWAMLRAVGIAASFADAFSAFVISVVVATLSLIPLGLGTFEASSVLLLHAAGIPLEPALTATLLLRGFTLWLPMLPGLWISRHALR